MDFQSAKKGGKVTRKKRASKTKIVQKAKQSGVVRTGAVVQIDLSRRAAPRTAARKDINEYKAQQLSLIPLLTGIQAQQAQTQAATSNIERLQMERDKLLNDARKAAAERAEYVRQDQAQAAHDARRRQIENKRASDALDREIKQRGEESTTVETQTEQMLEPEPSVEREIERERRQRRPAGGGISESGRGQRKEDIESDVSSLSAKADAAIERFITAYQNYQRDETPENKRKMDAARKKAQKADEKLPEGLQAAFGDRALQLRRMDFFKSPDSD